MIVLENGSLAIYQQQECGISAQGHVRVYVCSRPLPELREACSGLRGQLQSQIGAVSKSIGMDIVTHGMMGVANPVLQARVDWPWFVLSQFVFGAVAAFVVDRSEKIPVPPAGIGAGGDREQKQVAP